MSNPHRIPTPAHGAGVGMEPPPGTARVDSRVVWPQGHKRPKHVPAFKTVPGPVVTPAGSAEPAQVLSRQNLLPQHTLRKG